MVLFQRVSEKLAGIPANTADAGGRDDGNVDSYLLGEDGPSLRYISEIAEPEVGNHPFKLVVLRRLRKRF